MRMKRPHVAARDEVRITRDGDDAVIAFADPTIATTHLAIGPKVKQMTDQEILDCFNDCIRAQEQAAAEYVHVAVEIPPGKPQIQWFELGEHWTPRGDVLRCVVSDGGPDNEPIVYIDDRELSWKEFGRLLTTYAGWGMRIIVVPDDELDDEPRIEVREPEPR
jgi:hypothetical protein